MGFNMGVYNPSPSVVKNARAPRKPKQAGEGKLRHPKGKKHGGPCAKCDVVCKFLHLIVLLMLIVGSLLSSDCTSLS